MSLKNACHGCLSTDRQLNPIREHEKLYQHLLLKKSKHNIKILMMCWECRQILRNIQTFRMKITQAQKLLINKSLSQQNSLSNLTVSKKIDDYQIIIYEDEKIHLEPVKIESTIKQETSENIEIEVKINDDITMENIKEENDHDNDYDAYNDDHKGDVKKLDEALVPLDLLEKKVDIKVELGRKKRGVLKKKYRTIIFEDMNVPDKRHLYDVVKVDMDTIKLGLEKRRRKSSTKKFQCDRCFTGFAQQKFYDRHLAIKHSKKNKYECDVCGVRFPDRRRLGGHINEHFRLFVCKLCGAQFRERVMLYVHFKHGPHSRQLECRRCGARFDCNKPKEFFAHWKSMHGFAECDHCGMRCKKKSRLAHHIRIRHSPIRCKLCDSGFESYHALQRHNRRKHEVDTSERNYCVECDLQFANNLLYHEHVTRSVKHHPKPRIPCPDCERTYSKRCYMMNHYTLEHLKASKHICAVCDRRFLNGFRLRTHIKYFHEKAPKPKNHICSYCGRGFNTRRILDNHVRTHTGERPYACARCAAAFAQATALKTHERAAHK